MLPPEVLLRAGVVAGLEAVAAEAVVVGVVEMLKRLAMIARFDTRVPELSDCDGLCSASSSCVWCAEC
jgi:hypothetical protein